MYSDLHQRLMKARVDAGFRTAVDAARRFGWNEYTYRAHESGMRGVKPKTVREYAKCFKVSEPWLATGHEAESPQPTDRLGTLIPVICIAAEGLWQSTNLKDTSPLEMIPLMPNLRHPANAYFGVKVQGPSMNKVFAHGELLTVLDVTQSQIDLLDGDYAIVERIMNERNLREVTAKKIKITGKNIEFLNESDDWRYTNIQKDEPPLEDIDTRVIGRIEGGYRSY